MKEYKDDLEKLIKEEFERQADQEMQSVAEDETLPSMSADLKASLRSKIDERIRERITEDDTEKKVEDIYAGLSEEDRLAMEVGRKILREGKLPEEEGAESKAAGAGKIVVYRRKRRLKSALVVAAALVLVLAIGVTSMGGPGRVVKLVKNKVVEREVEKTISANDNKIIVEENEEEAYQIISEEFGIEPVRLLTRPEGMIFDDLELDKEMQTAWMTYIYEGEKIRYIIGTTFVDSVWGLDIEDEIMDEYTIENPKFVVTVKEYKILETSALKYSAKYKYNGLEYYLFGMMDKAEFEKIVKNLYI